MSEGGVEHKAGIVVEKSRMAKKIIKKLFRLLLMLGIVSSANAALDMCVDDVPTGPTVNIAEGQVVEITARNSEPNFTWLGYIIIEEGGLGELHLVDGPIIPIPYEDWGKVVEIGPDFVVKYSYTGDVIANPTFISLYIDPEYENPTDRFQVIPEPMTLILLGLGGLYLRRIISNKI